MRSGIINMLKKLEQIGTPEALREYQCKVSSYAESLSMLVIRIHHAQIASSVWNLTFIAVHYFEGPIRWKGANFETASDEVSIEVLRNVYPDSSDEYLARIIKLELGSVCTVQT